MKSENLKRLWIVLFVCLTAVIVAVLVRCSRTTEVDRAEAEAEEIVMVVPSDVTAMVSSLVSEFEEMSGVHVKLINIGGTTEEIHRFCVSVLMDKKFKADLLIIDDLWLKEFASQGLLSELENLSEYGFISAAEKGMKFEGKRYGAPIYADAMVEFRKYTEDLDSEIYFEDDINDMAAYVVNEMNAGASLEGAYQNYLDAKKTDRLSEFVDGDAKVLISWLSQMDVMQKYYPLDSRNLAINMSDSALVKTKLAVVNAESDFKEEALKVVKYLLRDGSQRKIIKSSTIVPIMRGYYSDPMVIDYAPYIEGTDGENFCTFPFSPEYNKGENDLKEVLNKGATGEEALEAMKYLTVEK